MRANTLLACFAGSGFMTRRWEQYIRKQCAQAADQDRVSLDLNTHRREFMHRLHLYDPLQPEDEPNPIYIGDIEVLISR